MKKTISYLEKREMQDLTKKLKEVEMVELIDIAKTIAVEINSKLVIFKNCDTEVKFLLEVKKENGASYNDFWLSVVPEYEVNGSVNKVSIPLTSSLSRALYLMYKDDEGFTGMLDILYIPF